ncbi:uncharacterized protein LOC134783596 [Penaeus indicus]|uniref:uncharacterized protein LOC134783596 n=1 Tax=Penaeus indicus TaxID=29960 RepID=UPI00300D3503
MLVKLFCDAGMVEEALCFGCITFQAHFLNSAAHQSYCQIERAQQRSPGDGDEAPRIVTADDKRDNDEKAAMTSQGMRAVATAEVVAASGGRQTAVPPQGSARQLTSWASGHRHAGHAAEAQEECTCKPHPTGIGGGGAVGGGGARGGPHGGSFRAPPQPPAHHRGPHSPVLPPKKSSQAAGGRRISLPEGPSQPPFFLQRGNFYGPLSSHAWCKTPTLIGKPSFLMSRYAEVVKTDVESTLSRYEPIHMQYTHAFSFVPPLSGPAATKENESL